MAITEEQNKAVSERLARYMSYAPRTGRIHYSPWLKEAAYKAAQALMDSKTEPDYPIELVGYGKHLFTSALAKRARSLGFRVDVTLKDPYGNYHVGERVEFISPGQNEDRVKPITE